MSLPRAAAENQLSIGRWVVQTSPTEHRCRPVTAPLRKMTRSLCPPQKSHRAWQREHSTSMALLHFAQRRSTSSQSTWAYSLLLPATHHASDFIRFISCSSPTRGHRLIIERTVVTLSTKFVGQTGSLWRNEDRTVRNSERDECESVILSDSDPP